MSNPDLLQTRLPQGVSSRSVSCPGVNLNFHFLEAGYEWSSSRKLILLLHGFPELAFSWRKVMLPLASAGYHVVAPDQRGYGRTTGWDSSDLSQFTSTTLVRDIVVFVHALGYRSVHCVVGHDFGAVSASMCVLMRPDMFLNLILMSHPYKSIPEVPFDTAHGGGQIPKPPVDIQAELAKLPEPRKHYRNYNSTPQAAADWISPAQGLQAFLRAYAHVKSADWIGNNPQPLLSWTAAELAKMPYYYIMPLGSSMPEAVEILMQGEDASKTLSWMSDDDLAVYVSEWSRTGFQGGLNWYKARTEPGGLADLQLFAGCKIDVPTLFLSGKQDWGNFQEPGALDSMPKTCTKFKGIVFVDGAGHWPQQEQPKRVADEIIKFASSVS